MEIIMNGHNLQAIRDATQAAIQASVNVTGLHSISAGNYGGRLGKSFIFFVNPTRMDTIEQMVARSRAGAFLIRCSLFIVRNTAAIKRIVRPAIGKMPARNFGLNELL